MKILISGGGTGGGTYPALAVAAALQKQYPDVQLLWIGSPHGIERKLVRRTGIVYRAAPGGPLVGVSLLRRLTSALKLVAGVVAALWHVLRFRPDALLMTGGWPVLPATLACALLRVPIVIYLPDLEPGSTIRALSRFARRVAASSGESAPYFRAGQVVECSYPLRPELLQAAGYDVLGEPLAEAGDLRAQAMERFGLEPGLPVLLAFGGSKGTRSINHALVAALPILLGRASVIHISGGADWPAVQRESSAALAGLPEEQARRYHAFEYLHTEDMALALSAADLAVSRAGASALGEFPLFGLPAILIPLAHAWRYQQVNADFLQAQGAAIRLDDERLDAELAPLLARLLDDPQALRRMAEAMASMRRPDAARRAADLVADVAKKVT